MSIFGFLRCALGPKVSGEDQHGVQSGFRQNRHTGETGSLDRLLC